MSPGDNSLERQRSSTASAPASSPRASTRMVADRPGVEHASSCDRESPGDAATIGDAARSLAVDPLPADEGPRWPRPKIGAGGPANHPTLSDRWHLPASDFVAVAGAAVWWRPESSEKLFRWPTLFTYSMDWPEWKQILHRPNRSRGMRAVGVAILLAKSELGYSVMERSRKGTGFDYWIGDETELPFDRKARLEISGIRKGSNLARTIHEGCTHC